MIIAIDGPAGSGKSTISKRVANRLGYFYLDTGAMYRALTFNAIQNKVSFSDEKALVALAEEAEIVLKKKNKKNDLSVFLNGKNVTKEIRLPHVTNEVKHIAKISAIRERLVRIQRAIAKGKNVVLEGRDTTTVVFPDAELKIYIDADQKERARRRFVELQEKGLSVAYEEILDDQIKRDGSDVARTVGSLKKATDAVVIDTTHMAIDEVVDRIISNVTIGRRVCRNYFAFMRWLCKVFIYFGFKRRTIGEENIPKYGGFIIASNHASHLDPTVVGSSVKREVHFLARSSLYKNPIFGSLILSVNAHPIRRGEADKGALSIAEELLHEGYGIILFPEGTRSVDGKLKRAKPGIGFIACRTEGSFEAFPKGSKKFNFGTPMTVVFGKPIKFSTDDGTGRKHSELYKEAAGTIMNHIQQLKDSIQ